MQALARDVNGNESIPALEAIDIRNRSTDTTARHASGGLFIFIGADADTGWLPAELARDRNGYVLTGDELIKAGRWSHHRDPFLLEASVPGIFACGDVRLGPVKRVASAVPMKNLCALATPAQNSASPAIGEAGRFTITGT